MSYQFIYLDIFLPFLTNTHVYENASEHKTISLFLSLSLYIYIYREREK